MRQTASAVEVRSLRHFMTTTVEGHVLADNLAYLLPVQSGKPKTIQKARIPQVYRR